RGIGLVWRQTAPNSTNAETHVWAKKRGIGGYLRGERALTCARALGVNGPLLDVAVEHELPRVRPKRDRVDFLLALVFDPGLDHVFREDAAFEQERVVLFQGVQRLGQRAGH